MSRRRLTVALPLLGCVFFGQSLSIGAAPPDDVANDAATPSASAVSVPRLLDVVTVFQTNTIAPAVRNAALAAASAAGAAASVGRGFSAGMTRLRRGSTVVQQASAQGWAFPMSITALPLETIGGVMGRAVSGPISQGQVVMGQTSADLRGAQAGDQIDLQGSTGFIQTFTIGLVAADLVVGGTEVLMSTQQADLLGMNTETRVVIYGAPDRAAMQAALVARGLYADSTVRVRKSWDAADPDSTLSLAVTKTLLGEFDLNYGYLFAPVNPPNEFTAVGAAWKAAYLPAGAEGYPTGIKAICNKVIKADLEAALAEVNATYPSLVNRSTNKDASTTGLDVANSNYYGGCSPGGLARLSRLSGNLGSVSRHSWGQALDVGTVANCQGCVPKMDCRIVRIFRKHNFAWGGNFLISDGMHFEWVGEPRNTLQYPSKYCPNLPDGQIQELNSRPSTGRATLFADDGLDD